MAFSCQEYAKLFVALARDVGVHAYYVHLEKDFRGRIVYHDCAAVFADGKALLADPAYRWFGPPHKEYLILDDLQAIAHHFFQPSGTGKDVARCRLAEKLHPNFAWGQVTMVSAQMGEGLWEDARKTLAGALHLAPDRWDGYEMQGMLDAHDGKPKEAIGSLRKSLALNPAYAATHFYLALVMLSEGQLKEAREEFRSSLQFDPPQEIAQSARHAIAEINEKIGSG